MAAAGAVLVVLGVAAAFALGVFGPSGAPIGKEVTRHTYQEQTYVLVEYGDKLAVFTESGAPVARRELAEGVLMSYAWRQAVDGFDIDELDDVSQKVRSLDDSVSDVRNFSNNVVDIFDMLDDLSASVPFFGRVSAMDVVRESFEGVGEAEDAIRKVDDELNELGDNSTSLRRATRRIRGLDLTSVSGAEMEELFADATDATEGLEGSVRSVKEFVSHVENLVDRFGRALSAGSGAPIIGDALGDAGRTVGQFERELSGLASLMGGFESELDALEKELRSAQDSADETYKKDVGRWLEKPHDTQWPPSDPERRPAGTSPSSS